MCERANIQVEWVASLDEVRERAHAQTYNYITFQTGDDGTPYSDILRQLQALFESGVDLHLGTFNLQTKILLLPDAICL